MSSRSQSVEAQRSAIERAAAQRGDRVDVWKEETRSVAKASNAPRPALDDFLELARRGELSRLYVFKLDRLTRMGIGATLHLVQEFRACGVDLVTIADGFTIQAGPIGELLLAVMGWAAQVETASRAERILAGQQRAREQGKQWGRPVKRVDQRTWDQIHALRSQGKTTREIARNLKIPRTTVRRWLGRMFPPELALAEGSKVAARKK